jgi:hypothetical protein
MIRKWDRRRRWEYSRYDRADTGVLTSVSTSSEDRCSVESPTEEYAIKIARDWNTRDAASGYVGFVLRFSVRSDYLSRFEIHEVGGRDHREYWIPSEELELFNANLVGLIEVIGTFRPDNRK